jgi:hypothetical protein
VQLPLDPPVVVLGDASYSMDVAIRTATVIGSLLTALTNAELRFFNVQSIPPHVVPRTIEQVLLSLSLSLSPLSLDFTRMFLLQGWRVDHLAGARGSDQDPRRWPDRARLYSCGVLPAAQSCMNFAHIFVRVDLPPFTTSPLLSA